VAAAAPQAGTFDLNRSETRRTSLLDHIADPAERKGFEAIYRKAPAGGRRAAAEDFLRRFPQSWFLAQAWEILAKACIEQEDYACALFELLDRFNGPHQFSEKAWKEEETALRASGNYVITAVWVSPIIGKAMLADAIPATTSDSKRYPVSVSSSETRGGSISRTPDHFLELFH
jgi:hypothetical protein